MLSDKPNQAPSKFKGIFSRTLFIQTSAFALFLPSAIDF